MFPLADTLRLPVFPSLRFRRKRTTFLYVSVKFPSKETRVPASVNAWHSCGNTRKRFGNKSISCFRQRNRMYLLRKHEFTSRKLVFSSYFHREKSAFHYLGVVFPPSIVTKTHSLDIFIAQNNTKAIFPTGAPNDNFRKIICSEDDLRSRILTNFWLACLS